MMPLSIKLVGCDQYPPIHNWASGQRSIRCSSLVFTSEEKSLVGAFLASFQEPSQPVAIFAAKAFALLTGGRRELRAESGSRMPVCHQVDPSPSSDGWITSHSSQPGNWGEGWGGLRKFGFIQMCSPL